jgi:DNA polymerase-3 subunit beta
MVFFVGESILITKLIDGNFPDYKRVIPKDNNNILKVNRQDFSLAVDRVSTITNDKSPAIKFKLLNNLMNMSSVNAESGTATEDIITSYSGEEIEIGFNSKYMLEMINNLEDVEITLSFKDSASPVIAVEDSNPELIYVLMPMRV